MPPGSLCSANRGPSPHSGTLQVALLPGLCGLTSKVRKCFGGEMMLLWLWLSHTKNYYFFLTAKIVLLSPKNPSAHVTDIT